DRTPLVRRRLREAVAPRALCEGDRGEQRPAPGAEVLRRELVAHVDLHVVVQALARQVVDVAFPAIAEDARAAGQLQQLAHRSRELVVDDLRPHLDRVLAAEGEADAVAADVDVAPRQRGDPVGARLARIALRPDAEPAEVDQPQRDRRDAFAVELVLVEMLRHHGPQLGQLLREADELVVLRLLLGRAVVGVVEVLLPPGLVDARRLELRAGARRDPDVPPRRRDGELLDPLELRRVADLLAPCVDVAKRTLLARPSPPHAALYTAHPMRDDTTIIVLEGDETGQELLEEGLRTLSPYVIGVELSLPRFDLSLARRRETGNAVVHEAAAAIREHGLGLKAATITPEGRGDVGSPNRILREEIGGKVIVRTGRRIPGVVPIGGVYAPISIVRMAVGDAYGAKEWREGEGDDEVAFRTERIERRVCHAVAEFAFRQADRTGAKVFGGPKYTVSPTYEGMLKEEMDAAAERHPEVPYEPQLIDATFALLLSTTGEPLVIPALNRDGDILSDLVLPLFGSIAGSESLLVAFADDFEPAAIMAEAAHGTAPSLEGKNVANPMAMILGAAALLSHAGDAGQRAGRAVREACLEAVASGARTADLGGELGTSEFTDDVISRVKQKLDVWAAL